MAQVGYRRIHWAHQSTNAIRKLYGTTDDLFVRKDVPLVKEEGWDAVGEGLDIDKLANEVREDADDLKIGLVPKEKRDDL